MTVVTVTEYHCHLHDDDADDAEDDGGGGCGGGNSDAGVDYFWWLTCLFYLPCILTWLQTINTVKQKYTRSVRDVFFSNNKYTASLLCVMSEQMNKKWAAVEGQTDTGVWLTVEWLSQ